MFHLVQYLMVGVRDAPTPKERLVQALVVHTAEHGLGDTSLRGLAAAVGTSHRMLNYHFGSRRDLLIDVSRAVAHNQRDALAELMADPAASAIDVMWSMYRRLADPAMRTHERLFFELYVRALHEGSQNDGFLADVVDAWIAPLSVLFKRLGFDDHQATDEARLALAVARGLILDLLATENRTAVDAAMGRFVSRYQPPSPPCPSQTK
jgi:AcrR family transcriptional regulator